MAPRGGFEPPTRRLEGDRSIQLSYRGARQKLAGTACGEARRLLALAHRNSLGLAAANKLETVAFPAISCGAYRFPIEAAADIALRACIDHGEGLREIHFVHFTAATHDAWIDVADRLLERGA